MGSSRLLDAFSTSAKLRNTTGHNLVWDDGSVCHLATAPIEARGDDALRVFVRVLARRAARGLFECERRCKTEVLHEMKS
jgi:hypothetical protein